MCEGVRGWMRGWVRHGKASVRRRWAACQPSPAIVRWGPVVREVCCRFGKPVHRSAETCVPVTCAQAGPALFQRNVGEKETHQAPPSLPSAGAATTAASAQTHSPE
ncbi:hypothetical protein STRTUCAR8_05812 [Streptomyces turgidiscabies Car8]|uniref:Uncharacterized protein n=1 Tax=Streptomyces turgidiscabies (strain Car8) TaxID=698760 RepID=L7FE26_STRT8|nr:hypothetical protein STRTUCAR8_05812 [Streptomyces turgidiscabies Car8]